MTTRSRLAVFLTLGGVLTMATLALLYALVRDSGNPTPAPALGSGAQVSVHPASQSRRDPPPRLPPPSADGNPGDAPGLPKGDKEYSVGDVRVRDHRPGDPKPIDLPPNIHRPQSRMLPLALTTELSQQMRNVVRECTRSIPAAARGAKPQFEAQVSVAIDNHRLSIVDVVSQLRDVEGPTVDLVRDCVARNVAGLTISAADQDDIANYGLRLSFIIP